MERNRHRRLFGQNADRRTQRLAVPVVDQPAVELDDHRLTELLGRPHHRQRRLIVADVEGTDRAPLPPGGGKDLIHRN